MRDPVIPVDGSVHQLRNKLGFRPKYVKVYQIASENGYNIYVFEADKYESMEGNDGSQSNITSGNKGIISLSFKLNE